MLSHSISTDALGEISLLRSPLRTQQSQEEIKGEGEVLALSRTTRQRIAIQLLSDPADLSPFNDLVNRVIRSNSTGLQLVQLIADALCNERVSLQEPLQGRLIALLCAAPRSNEVVTLAISCLSVARDQESQIEYEDLVLAALSYLKNNEPSISARQRFELVELATEYRNPAGNLFDGRSEFSNLIRKPHDEVDIVAAGCLLLVSRCNGEMPEAVREEMGTLLQKEALRFTKNHPQAPNLWITAMRGAAPERLATLTYLQRYGLSPDKALAILKRGVLEAVSFSFTFYYVTNRVFNIVQQQGAGWVPAMASALIGSFWACSSFLTNFTKEIKRNTLSPAHKQQLRRELRRGEGK